MASRCLVFIATCGGLSHSESLFRRGERIRIEAHLHRLPKKYGRRLYSRKCEEVYEHVHESYYGEGRSVYGGMAV